jgi:dethiobiotin synthetase
MSAYFIASTGTGVGKTFTTCALLHAARACGANACGYKPVISGWDDGDTTDTAQIIKAGGELQTTDDTSPWRFFAPLSPHRAAALEGKTLDMDALIAWTRTQAARTGLTLIETVGGVMVPLTDTATTLDWMAAAKLPVILVVGSYLGTISHTLTALHALHSRGLSVAALVLNETAGSSVTLAEAHVGLAPFIGDIALRITQPLVSSWRAATEIHALGDML